MAKDSVGSIVEHEKKPTMTHALDMINAMIEPQYEGHGGIDARHTGMPDENLMRRAVDALHKNR